MCRLMMFNRAFALEHTEAQLADVFTRLNTIQGGHGMGVFLSGEKPLLKKGTKLKGKDVARVVYKNLCSKSPFEYCVFHCRLAGPAGSICDENSQPYYDEECDMSLAHNGVAAEFCNSKYDYSDTELLLRVMCDYGIPIRNLEYYSGVFIGTNQGVPYVVKGAEWTDLELLYNDDSGAWCFMSVALYPLTKKPYKTVRIKKCVWQGHDVESVYLEGLSNKYTSSHTIHYQHMVNGRWVDDDEYYNSSDYDTEHISSRVSNNKSISTMTNGEFKQYDMQEWEKELEEEEKERNEKIDKNGYATYEQVQKFLESGK